jgi:Fe-S-cluster-containing hydrogenase component 2
MSEPATPPDDKSPGDKPKDDKSKAPGKPGKTVYDVSWSDISLSELLKEQTEPAAETPTPPPPKKPIAPPQKVGGEKSFAELTLDEVMALPPSPAAPISITGDSWSDVPVAPKPKPPAPPVAEKPVAPPVEIPKPPPPVAEKPTAPAKPAESATEKIKEVAVNPEAMLFPRKKDIQIPLDKLVVFRDSIGLFSQLKSKPSVEKWPGTLVLRRYHPGEVVCRQGEAGDTAFYIITSADEERLRFAKFLEPARTIVDLDIHAEALGVHLAIARASNRPKGLFERIADRFAKKKTDGVQQPKFIPIDAPVGVDYETRRASLSAGELFGEMSCLYRTPRSATVVAERDCYVVEMLRNVLDQLKKDPKFKEEMDRKYKERVFGLQVRNLPLFQDLPDEVIAWLRDRANLKSYRSGQIIFDEHERPDDMVIIRNGLVKVCQGVSNLYSSSDILNWPGLMSQFAAAEAGTAIAQVRDKLAEALRVALADPAAVSESQWQDILYSLNDIIKGPPLGEIEKQPAPGPLYQSMLGSLPKLAKDRTELEVRKLNRTFLDERLGGLVRPRRLAAGPESILTYVSRGELIGEIGVVHNCPRTASCLASTHPRFGQAKEDVKSTEEEFVEVVQLSAEVFRELLAKPEAESVRRQVDSLIAARRKADAQRQKLGSAADAKSVTRRLSPEFEKLGLIQGTQLMLIDLDRCTRCDECVRACADTHTDGRSRLFLEGPRFEHYLVPITCRSCLDPVCLIGCPVGSIHRGDNKEIRIEDWCIGCNMCARQCPYGSIQMHDVGVIASAARGWRFHGDAGDVDPTKRPRLANWPVAAAPFRKTRDFRAAVGAATSYWFALEFDVPKELLHSYTFEVELTAPDATAMVFLNGQEVKTEERLKKDKRLFPIADPKAILQAKNNIVLVRTTPKPDEEGTIFDLRLDASPKPVRATDQPVEYTEKAVTSRAVVCDLCSTLPGQVPSCVNACPHDAAMRVDARANFPAR